MACVFFRLVIIIPKANHMENMMPLHTNEMDDSSDDMSTFLLEMRKVLPAAKRRLTIIANKIAFPIID
jgi:hypothetical protein